MTTRHDLTGLVLAGGQGRRMGGVDKGLQPLHGKPLAQHVLERLRPQVGALLISANRNLDLYRAYGYPVVTDAGPDSLGPLAGLLAGMQAAGTSHLLCVPCDVPYLPETLADTLLAAAQAQHSTIAYATTVSAAGEVHRHPACALLACTLASDLQAYLADGGRRVSAWYARHNPAEARFPDQHAFYNVNSLQELSLLAQEPR